MPIPYPFSNTRKRSRNRGLKIACLAGLLLPALADSAEPIILDDAAVANLGIEVVDTEYRDFAQTLFAVGRIEPIPSRKSFLSSRVPGRIKAVYAHEGDVVSAGQTLVEIESLQPGNPPPRIRLDAPQDGMVMQSHTHLGKPVAPDSELFEIIDLREVYAVARLPEDQAGALQLGSHAEIRVAALGDQRFDGTLARFGTTANAASGTIDAYFVIENPDSRIRPSMRAEFSLLIGTKSDTLSVPKDAIQSDGINRFVFVEDFSLPNAFVKAPVKIGAQNEQYAEVLSGLFPGDSVVTKGSYALMFAGGGSISLKEALDAAHGHEHNEDGSEMTAAQKATQQHEQQAAAGGSGSGPLTLFLGILSGLLATLLLLCALKLKSQR
ncbi:efflux RND transporter periplasmic adaptor subunit [Pelagicoccus sp. SDUM812003]|uniref:efflux RND transporter periplasmic adaptor subunit n=1 Tax=Pelagicoccus sp. SDUM812003 TaxID=3041267 RepID=UPI0028105585|nr:efflux RND transporter periplasmic adaptor subunit [Pelagicoccus sp. SDUM812003]MDQ8205231.1 efflux RND transporter periplasmic adaptor subunit [Pelagicoccus sp. SDUM812003]